MLVYVLAYCRLRFGEAAGHARAHLSPAHFDRWLALWCAAVDDRYAGPTAELAKLQATRVAGAMSRRITGQEPAPGAATLAPTDQP